jgi:hypothetical protein
VAEEGQQGWQVLEQVQQQEMWSHFLQAGTAAEILLVVGLALLLCCCPLEWGVVLVVPQALEQQIQQQAVQLHCSAVAA